MKNKNDGRPKTITSHTTNIFALTLMLAQFAVVSINSVTLLRPGRAMDSLPYEAHNEFNDLIHLIKPITKFSLFHFLRISYLQAP